MNKKNRNKNLNIKVTHTRRLLLVLSCLLASQALAQFSMKKHTINSGGAKMTGGSYQLTSSIGQVDASNTLVGGTYSFKGGFWTHGTNTNTNEIIFENSFE